MSSIPNHDLTEAFSDIIQTISGFKTLMTNLQNQLRTLEKNNNRKIKQLERDIAKRTPKVKRKPSGFAKPTQISQDLCTFLHKPPGTHMARTSVTKELINYIKAHNLQNPDNKRPLFRMKYYPIYCASKKTNN